MKNLKDKLLACFVTIGVIANLFFFIPVEYYDVNLFEIGFQFCNWVPLFCTLVFFVILTLKRNKIMFFLTLCLLIRIIFDNSILDFKNKFIINNNSDCKVFLGYLKESQCAKITTKTVFGRVLRLIKTSNNVIKSSDIDYDESQSTSFTTGMVERFVSNEYKQKKSI